jgi:hypothetical protein
VLIIKAAPAGLGEGLTRFVCKPPAGGSFTLPSTGAAPLGTGGFVVDVNVVPPGTGVDYFGATCMGLGNPAGAKGYKCSHFWVPVLIVKEKVIKAVVKLDLPFVSHDTTHPYPSTSDVAIRLTAVGDSDQKQYCARFGGPPPLRNDAAGYRGKDAPAPPACSPSGAFLDAGEAGF